CAIRTRGYTYGYSAPSRFDVW
nr:immunoglobulin heavy chain junction region [Macaca mulatta]